MKVAVKTLENKESGEVTLDDAIFGVEVREDILHRVVNWQLAKRRAGTAKTKQRHEVSGTGKKPFKQKGTGRARAGDLKRNIDRGGAVVFGPQPKSFEHSLPKKIRNLALRMALSSKIKNKKFIVLDDAKAKSHKTKPMAEALAKMKLESVLVIGGKEIDVNFARATANIPLVDVLPAEGANVYDILRRDTLVLTKDAVADLTERLKG